ncbi:hypothetical protein ACFFQW_33560 [Umezawaea endophytica]|uniref:Uncharacterized protein n=1 Tax=Umezawaea endophytica TaxID=1654476 RepID=A0A9X2VPV3_9PSEU|nr:hypothetical protein [Umezawaea endophytica]MCS7480500.1 hypothetical protein [Umezawaea endophytica]
MSSTAEDDGRPTTPAAPDDAPTTPFAPPDGPRHWVMAAVGALNRRDLRFAVAAAQRVLTDQDSTMAAVEVLSGILLTGIPQGSLRRGARVPLGISTPPGDTQSLRAAHHATDLITAIASGDDELATPVLHALGGPHGLDILIVLIRAAAARVEGFVGVDGDTVDAYYAASRTHQGQSG